jgi:hypothetical protein
MKQVFLRLNFGLRRGYGFTGASCYFACPVRRISQAAVKGRLDPVNDPTLRRRCCPTATSPGLARLCAADLAAVFDILNPSRLVSAASCYRSFPDVTNTGKYESCLLTAAFRNPRPIRGHGDGLLLFMSRRPDVPVEVPWILR